jgi:hypothetical protein
MDNARSPDSDTAPTGPLDTAAERRRPPWERPEDANPFQAFFETVGDVLLSPKQTFRTMAVTAGMGRPYVFWLLPSLLAWVLSTLIQSVVLAILAAIGLPAQSGGPVQAAIGLGMVLVAPFALAGLYHLMLAVVGAGRNGFRATFRVVAYQGGSTALFAWVPIIGGLLALVWGTYITVVGLAQTHETSVGRAVLAVALTVLFIIVVVVAIVVIALATGTMEEWLRTLRPPEV